MRMSRSRATTWLGLTAAALVAGGIGVTVVSAASQPPGARLAASHASPSPVPAPRLGKPAPAPVPGAPLTASGQRWSWQAVG